MSKIMRAYNTMHKCYKRRIPIIPKLIYYYIRVFYSAEIPPSCTLEKGVDLVHGGLGVVIHDKAIVGSGTKIYQNVTIAGKTNLENPDARRYPIIGRNVMIGAGACILGGITIGNNVQIGANAVVTHDVPDGAIVVGIPARPIGSTRKN